MKAFDDFENKQKSAKVCKSIYILKVYSIHYKKTVQKMLYLFLSRAPTHHSFTFNLRFLYELKHKVRLSKTMCWIFHFRFRFVFIKINIFFQQNTWTLRGVTTNSGLGGGRAGSIGTFFVL